MAKLNWAANRWADEAGLHPTTVTRNMSVSHDATAKIENLHVLARAAGMPSVVDFLEWQAQGKEVIPANEAELNATFEILLDSVGLRKDGNAQKLAERFPGVLQSVLALRAGASSGDGSSLGERVPDPAEDRPAA